MYVLVLAVALGACEKRSRSTQADEEVPAEALRRKAKVPSLAFAAFTRAGPVVTGGAGTTRFGQEPTIDVRYHAASIAKLVLAVLAMRAVEDGSLSLEKDVATYVDFPVRPSVTVRTLLSHTSPVRDLETIRPPAPSLGGFLKGYFAREDVYAGDGAYAYSNAGAALAAYAIERAAGADYRDLARTRVFEPLQMKQASFHPSNDVAPPSRAKGAGFEALPPPTHAVYPASDLYATVRDLERFGRAILRGGELDGVRILSERSVSEMLRPQFPGIAPDQALAFQIRVLGGARVVGHEGEDEGTSTALFLDVEAGAGAVVLANGDAFASGSSERIGAISELLEKLLAVARRRTLR